MGHLQTGYCQIGIQECFLSYSLISFATSVPHKEAVCKVHGRKLILPIPEVVFQPSASDVGGQHSLAHTFHPASGQNDRPCIKLAEITLEAGGKKGAADKIWVKYKGWSERMA